MWKRVSKLAVGLLSLAFSVFLAKGNLDFIPNWTLLLIMSAAGIAWLLYDPNVRELVVYLYKSEGGRLVHPSTYEPLRRPSVNRAKVVWTVVGVMSVSMAIGGSLWAFRKHKLATASSVRPRPHKIIEAPGGWTTGWGARPPNFVYVMANATYLVPYDQAHLMLVCRVADNTVDVMEDTRLEKSAPFSIIQSQLVLEMPLSQAFLRRGLPDPHVDIALVLLPPNVIGEQISKLSDVKRLGGQVLAINGLRISLTQDNNQLLNEQQSKPTT
jgi:hypothetical protein